MRFKSKFAAVFAAVMLVVSFYGTSVFADGDILERGSKGSEVEELQTLLQQQGYFDYDTITGYFGKITEDAVKEFQSDNGLKADGVVGEQTWELLRSADQNGEESSDDTTDETQEEDESGETQDPEDEGDSSGEETEEDLTTISEGMEGEAVEEVQLRLQELGLYEYSRISGYYGLVTVEAVKAFQKAYGLEQDGVVGPQTMEKLFSTYKESSVIPGMVSEDVEEIQERLSELGYYSYSVDGEYGTKTREAIVYFQSAHGLTADGIAGTQTKQLLYSSAAMTEQEARRAMTTAEEEGNSATATPEPVQTQEEVAAATATPEPETTDEEQVSGEDEAAATTQPTATPTPEPTEAASSSSSVVDQAIALAKSKLGCSYEYGEEGPNTFDCSGFTYYIMKQFGVSLPRTAYNQGYDQYGVKITDKASLQPGDLVFFNTNNSDGDLSDHVGIYIGDGQFIHASSGTAYCVVISNLNTNSYYKAAFSWGRRVLD